MRDLKAKRNGWRENSTCWQVKLLEPLATSAERWWRYYKITFSLTTATRFSPPKAEASFWKRTTSSYRLLNIFRWRSISEWWDPNVCRRGYRAGLKNRVNNNQLYQYQHQWLQAMWRYSNADIWQRRGRLGVIGTIQQSQCHWQPIKSRRWINASIIGEKIGARIRGGDTQEGSSVKQNQLWGMVLAAGLSLDWVHDIYTLPEGGKDLKFISREGSKEKPCQGALISLAF